MKIKVNRKETIENVGRVGSVASKKPTLPIIEYAKISVRTDGMMVVYATDGELSSMRKFRIAESFSETIDFCIHPRDFVSVLKTIKDEEVVLVVENNTCVIEHTKGRTSLQTLPAEDFPAISTESNATIVDVSTNTLFDWLKNGSKFVATDKLRPILCGVYIYAKNGEMGVAASDTSMLYADYINDNAVKDIDVNGTISIRAVAPLLDMIDGEEKVSVRFGEKSIAFRTPTAMVSCLRTVGNFPNFKRVIAKKENPITVVVEKEDLIDSASRAVLSADAVVLLKIKIEGQSMNLDSENLGYNKSSHEELFCQHEGEDVQIGVKGSNLLECLGAIDSSEVRFELSDGRSAINVYEIGNPNKSIILMPILVR